MRARAHRDRRLATILLLLAAVGAVISVASFWTSPFIGVTVGTFVSGCFRFRDATRRLSAARDMKQLPVARVVVHDP